MDLRTAKADTVSGENRTALFAFQRNECSDWSECARYAEIVAAIDASGEDHIRDGSDALIWSSRGGLAAPLIEPDVQISCIRLTRESLARTPVPEVAL